MQDVALVAPYCKSLLKKPTEPFVVSRLPKSNWLVLVPSGDALPVPPMKLTLAPELRTRLAMVTVELAPVTAAAAKPAWMIDWPPPSVIVPTLDGVVTSMLLLPWNTGRC